MQYTYGKEEKLKSKKLIAQLFEKGEVLKNFPLRMVYLKIEHGFKYPVQAGVSVSKRNFKRAVDRNRIKRLIREAYRLNKYILYDNLNEPYIMMFIYLGKKMPDFSLIDDKMKAVLQKFVNNQSNSIESLGE